MTKYNFHIAKSKMSQESFLNSSWGSSQTRLQRKCQKFQNIFYILIYLYKCAQLSFIQMHLFEFSFYGAGILFAIFNYPILILFFLMFVTVYTIISVFYTGAINVGVRKKIMMATWKDPSEGIIYVNVKVQVNKALNFLQSYSKQQRPTLTHIFMKTLGELLQQIPQINGKIVFGKFIPYKTCDAICLVDTGFGKDFGILVKQIEKKSIEDIRDQMRKFSKAKKDNQSHQVRKQNVTFLHTLPGFLIALFFDAAYFLRFKLGFLGFANNSFGAVSVSSLGMLGLENATAPFAGFMGQMCHISLNKIIQQPVFENGNLQIGKVMNINFVVDHRYVDGAKAKKFTEVIKRVFDNPEKYADKGSFHRNKQLEASEEKQ